MTSATNSDNIKAHLIRSYIDERLSKDNKPYFVKVDIWNMPNNETYQLEKFLTREEVAVLRLTVPIQQTPMM